LASVAQFAKSRIVDLTSGNDNADALNGEIGLCVDVADAAKGW
jgi:hypothetical protein